MLAEESDDGSVAFILIIPKGSLVRTVLRIGIRSCGNQQLNYVFVVVMQRQLISGLQCFWHLRPSVNGEQFRYLCVAHHCCKMKWCNARHGFGV